MNSDCLNCATSVTQNYCPNCGQKSTTHRYSIKHFVEHDFVHGVWHVDKGILFTVKELFTRPGHSVREYIQGKRANYFSFVTLILLILTITALLSPYLHIKLSDLLQSRANSFEEFATKYPKILVLVVIPINSFFSYLWFRKVKLNYSEHLVANSYKAAAELIIGLFFTLLMIGYPNIEILRIIYGAIMLPLILVYGIRFYYQFFSAYGYSKKELLLRSVMIIVTNMVFQFIVGIIWGIIEMQQQA